MTKARRVIFSITVVLALVVLFQIWWGVSMDGRAPSLQGRVALPLQWGGTLMDSLGMILATLTLPFWIVLLGFVIVGWIYQRKTGDGFEPLVVLGTFLVMLGFPHAMLTAGRMAAQGGGVVPLRGYEFDHVVHMCGIGAVLCLLGLLRIARQPWRRGAIIGFCTIVQATIMSWYVHQIMIAPRWAQPRNLMGGVTLPVEELGNQGYPWGRSSGAKLELAWASGAMKLEFQEQPIELDELGAALARFAEGFGLQESTEDGETVRYVEASLHLFLDEDVPMEIVGRVLEDATAAGFYAAIAEVDVAATIHQGFLWFYLPFPPVPEDAERLFIHGSREAGGEQALCTFRGASGDVVVEAMNERYKELRKASDQRPSLIVSAAPDATWQDAVSGMGKASIAFDESPLLLVE